MQYWLLSCVKETMISVAPYNVNSFFNTVWAGNIADYILSKQRDGAQLVGAIQIDSQQYIHLKQIYTNGRGELR